MHKQIILLTMVVILLNSCAPNTTPNTTATSAATVTSTFTPVLATSTITPTPTETPDPNMPADAMGKDTNGYYKDVQENGKTVRYYWVEAKATNDTTADFKGWFSSHILDGNSNGYIPLIDEEFQNPPLKLIPLYVYVQEGLVAPFLRHDQGSTNPYAPDFSHIFYSYLVPRIYQKSFSKMTQDNWRNSYSDLQAGKVSFSFTRSGVNYVWKPSPTIGYKFYIIKWDDADPALHPEFYQTVWGNVTYRWTIYSDPDGTLVVFAAEKYRDIKDPENLNVSDYNDETFLIMIFQPLMEMLDVHTFLNKVKYWQNFYVWGIIGSGYSSGCSNVNVQGGANQNQAVQACSAAHFEVIRNP